MSKAKAANPKSPSPASARRAREMAAKSREEELSGRLREAVGQNSRESAQAIASEALAWSSPDGGEMDVGYWLCEALRKGSREAAAGILGAGASPDGSAWHRLAASLAAERADVESLEMLARAGADLNKGYWEGKPDFPASGGRGPHRDGMGETPLIAAAHAGALEAALWLLSHGADPNKADGRGIGPLHWAAARMQGPVAKALLAAGADPRARDGDGMTPLMRAAAQGHDCEALRAVHEAAPETLDWRDKHGVSAADHACRARKPDAFVALAELGALRCDSPESLQRAMRAGWGEARGAMLEAVLLRENLGGSAPARRGAAPAGRL